MADGESTAEADAPPTEQEGEAAAAHLVERGAEELTGEPGAEERAEKPEEGEEKRVQSVEKSADISEIPVVSGSAEDAKQGADKGRQEEIKKETTADAKEPEEAEVTVKDTIKEGVAEAAKEEREIPTEKEEITTDVKDEVVADASDKKISEAGEAKEGLSTKGGSSLAAEKQEEDAEKLPRLNELRPDTPAKSEAAVALEVSYTEKVDKKEESEPEEKSIYNGEQLLEQYHEEVSRREQRKQLNNHLQQKLADYFKKKKPDDHRQDFDRNAVDNEQRYLKLMARVEELQMEEKQVYIVHSKELEEKQKLCEEKKEEINHKYNKFVNYKKSITSNAVHSRTGKPLPLADVEQFFAISHKKELDIACARLENIKLKAKLKQKENALKSKEELTEGLHLIDFEQLKIENQTYNEKIEERNEELLKLRRKITSTVQILTHLKEKLQFVHAENEVYMEQLNSLENLVAQKRDVLNRTKHVRDSLKKSNISLRMDCGLLGKKNLLRDYEDMQAKNQLQLNKLEYLKRFYAEITMQTKQIQKKIKETENI